jgi:hypothetical protein
MYKNRITKWSLDKKNKEAEVRANVRNKFSRAAVGKSSTFYIRGRPANMSRIQQYIRKKGMTESELALARASSSTPPALECHTSPTLPSSPFHLPAL